MKHRKFCLLLHRYVGLAMAAFLIVVSLTGSLLAFYTELDNWINPNLSVQAEGRKQLDPATLLTIAENLDPALQPDSLQLSSTAATIWLSPKTKPTGQSAANATNDQFILNPYTGELLIARKWGDLSQGIGNLLPFIYKLHYALALDDFGGWILGIVALLWTLDNFAGFYLTLPAKHANPLAVKPASGKSYRQRWQPAWLIKFSGSATRINFDMHRAGGLWLWLVLLIFAWSSVYMNLGGFYTAVTQTLSDYHQPWRELPDLPAPLQQAKITWQQAQQIGQQALEHQAAQQGVILDAPASLEIDRGKGFYAYGVHSDSDVQTHGGRTRAFIDANTGEIKMLLFPTGQYNGNTITNWLIALHMANIWGLPYQIFVCLFGLAIVMLSITGILIWLKKRHGKRGKTHSASKHV